MYGEYETAEVANKGSVKVEEALSKTRCVVVVATAEDGRTTNRCYRKEGEQVVRRTQGFCVKDRMRAINSAHPRLVVRPSAALSAGVAAQTLLTYFSLLLQHAATLRCWAETHHESLASDHILLLKIKHTSKATLYPYLLHNRSIYLSPQSSSAQLKDYVCLVVFHRCPDMATRPCSFFSVRKRLFLETTVAGSANIDAASGWQESPHFATFSH